MYTITVCIILVEILPIVAELTVPLECIRLKVSFVYSL